MTDRIVDRAWAQVVNASGHVRGKIFRMSRMTLTQALAERGQHPAGRLVDQAHFLYGVCVHFDDSLKHGVIYLEAPAARRCGKLSGATARCALPMGHTGAHRGMSANYREVNWR